MMQTRFLSSRSAFSLSGPFGARHFTNPLPKPLPMCRVADLALYLWFSSSTKVDVAETMSNRFLTIWFSGIFTNAIRISLEVDVQNEFQFQLCIVYPILHHDRPFQDLHHKHLELNICNVFVKYLY